MEKAGGCCWNSLSVMLAGGKSGTEHECGWMWKYNSSLRKISAHEPVRSQDLTHVKCRRSPQLLYRSPPAGALKFSSQHRGKCEGFQFFFAMVGRPVKQSWYLLYQADPDADKASPCYCPNDGLLPPVAISPVCTGSSSSEPPCRAGSWPERCAPAPAGVLRVEAEQGQQSEPFDSQHKRCPVQAAFGQPASCCADTLPWHDGTGRHKSAKGQRGSGCENQRTAPVEVPVILYMKLLDKTTAFIQLC